MQSTIFLEQIQNMIQVKKQKVTLTELQRYLPFPCPDGGYVLPTGVQRYLQSPMFGLFSNREQNSIKEKLNIAYRNYYTIEKVVDHLDKLTNGKYYQHSLQMAVKNAAEKYQLIDWYKFYRTVKRSSFESKNISRIYSSQRTQLNQAQFKQKYENERITKIAASQLIKHYFRKYRQRKRIKKGRQQVQQMKRTIEMKLIEQFSKQAQKQLKQFYYKNHRKFTQKIKQFESTLFEKRVNFVSIEKFINEILQAYMERKKIIYLYLHFDPDNRGYFMFQNFKQKIFELRRESAFVAQKDFLKNIDMVLQSVRKDMKSIFHSAYDMIQDFNQKYLQPYQIKYRKDDEIQLSHFYRFVSEKGKHKYSKYQVLKVLDRIKYFQNIHYLFNQSRPDQILKALMKISVKKQKKKILHSQNQVFYSYKKILMYVVSRCKSQKLTKEGFSQFIVSQDPTLKYNSFFCVWRVYGNIINIKRIKNDCGLNELACYLKTVKSDEEYDKLYQELFEAYPTDLQVPYSTILDKLNLRLQFLLQNNNLKPLGYENIHEIINYRQAIKQIFQPDFDIISRAYIHRKVSSKFIVLFRRAKFLKKQKQRRSGMNILAKLLTQQPAKGKKDTIQSNGSSIKVRSSKKITTQKSIHSCKTKKSQMSQKKYNPQDLQMMKDILFDLIDEMKSYNDKKTLLRDSLNQHDDRNQFVTKSKITLVKKQKISFRSSLSNSLLYHQSIGFVLYGNNNEIMCYRNQKLQILDIKILYRPNIQILALQIFDDSIVLFTSYFTLEFYKFNQINRYPFKTIKVIDNKTEQLSNVQIEQFSKSGQHGAYPKLIKTMGQQILAVNLSFVEESIFLLKKEDQAKQHTIFKINMTKREHYFSKQIQQLLNYLRKKSDKKTREQKNHLINDIVDFLQSIKQQIQFEQNRQFFDSKQQTAKAETVAENKQGQKNISIPALLLPIKQQQLPRERKPTNQLEKEKEKQDSANKLVDDKSIPKTPKINPLNLINVLKDEALRTSTKNDMSLVIQKNYKKFLSILQTKQQNQRLQKHFSQYQFFQILKYFLYQTEKQFFKCQLKQQLDAFNRQLSKIKLPQQIKEVTINVQQYLYSINLSLKNLIQKLDDLKQGYIKVKRIKDYFLKITQQAYLINEKKIDSYLRNMAVSKHISYQSFISFFTQWKIKIWEKPRLVVRDYILIEKYSLLIYTLDEEKRIYVKNIQCNKIVAILEGHNSVPTICLIEDQLILVSGDSSKTALTSIDLHFWIIQNDIVFKLSQDNVLKVKSSIIIKNVHQQGITSISYLPRSDCLVTASLDSTLKFHEVKSKPFRITQFQRVYYHDYFCLATLSKNIDLQSDLFKQSLVTLRTKKHINQKNINKYDITLELYDIQKLSIKIPKKNEFIDIPVQLCSLLNGHGQKLIAKKQKLLTRKNLRIMQSQITSQFLQKSLQANIYTAIKRFFIFNDHATIHNLITFVNKKENGSSIFNNFCLKYGLEIVQKDFQLNGTNYQFSIQEKSNNINQISKINLIDQNLSKLQQEIVKGKFYIQLFQQQYHRLIKLFQSIGQKRSNLLTVQVIRQIAQQFIFGNDLEKFNSILTYELKKTKQTFDSQKIKDQRLKMSIGSMKNISSLSNISQPTPNQRLKQNIPLHINQIIKYFKVSETENNIDKFYKYLRQAFHLLKKKRIPLWKLFTTYQQNVSRQRKISANNFSQQLKKIGLTVQKIDYILTYLSQNEKISIFQTLNYLQMALKKESNNQSHFQPNISQFLKSSIIEEEQKQLIKLQDNKISILSSQPLKKNSNSRQNIFMQELSKKLEGQSSSKKQRRSDSGSGKSIKASRNQTPALSNRNKSRSGSKKQSRKLTPSNSMGNLTRQISYSNTKDSKKRQVYEIRHKLHNLLSNEKKTLWELVSSAVPQFIQEPVITENQYFDIFKLLKSNLRLSEKLNLLHFLKNQNPQRVIDLNDLFDLLDDSNKSYVHGQKYIIPYFVNKIISSDQNLTIQQGLQLFFFSQQEEQITLQQFIQRCCLSPFKFSHFGLKQFQQLLIRQSKSGFIKEDILDLIDKISHKYDISIENKNLSILEQILFKMDKRKISFQEIFPKVQMVKQTYFLQCIYKLSKKYEKKSIIKDFQLIKLSYKKSLRKNIENLQSSSRRSGKSTVSKILQIPYPKFKSQIIKILDQTRQSTDKQRQSARKLIRYLQSKRISVFNFFISLDLQKKFYLNEIQFETGLIEIGIGHSFWKAISRKYENRMFYYEFVRYLVDNGVLDIKCIDSELEIAMQKLLKRVIKNTDIQQFYQKLIDEDSKSQLKCVTFKSFNKFFSTNYSFFSRKQIVYLFSTFCNSQQIKNSKFSNDQVIKNQQNLQKTFNFKMFLDIVSIYKTQTITRTPQFKFIDYIKKRGLSLANQFYKFLQKNKKIKDVSQALKNKTTLLSKQIIFNFINQIKAGLNQKELKQIISIYNSAQIDFSLLNEKLEQIYRKASSYIQKQQAQVYLGEIYKKSKTQNVSIERLFVDFCQQKNNKLTLKDFIALSSFLNIGLNKIQLKKVFSLLLDQQNRGFCLLSQLLQAIDNIEQKIDKEEQDYEFEYIMQKIQKNIKLVLIKPTQLTISPSRCNSLFQKFLIRSQSQHFYKKVCQQLKVLKQPTQRDIFAFIQKKSAQQKQRSDKKYKQLVFNLLNTLKKSNIDILQVFKYFTIGSRNSDNLPKDRFLLLYQSVVSKANILDVNNLYQYFDDTKVGGINGQRWQEKLAIFDMQNQNIHGTVDQLKVFYKVKVFLADLYLTFIQKQFKLPQIYHYFDKNGTGILKYNDFWTMVYDLGIQPSQQVQKKVLNYLDRNKSKSISISILMNQLENCLGRKQKIVLQTKTSLIFKKNEQILKTKYNYLIQELIKKQELVQKASVQNQQVHQESCILEIEFLSILKRFGIYLTEQQQVDLKKNFIAKQDYLYLYPIYFMLKSIFEEYSSFQQKDQSQKKMFKTFFKEMIKNKITLKQIQKIKSHGEMKGLLKQLKTFTPIQVEILLENISYQETSVIDTEKLKIKIRDSYISAFSFQLNNFATTNNFSEINLQDQSLQIIVEDQYLNQALRDNLRSNLKFQENIHILKKYPKNLYQDDFKQILIQFGCKIKVADMRAYFKAFSTNKKYVVTQNLLTQQSWNSQKIKQNNQNQQLCEQVLLLIEHIKKSLKYVNKKFGNAVQKYYMNNYGVIKVQNLKKFLKQIGYQQGQSQDKTVQKILSLYLQNFSQNQKTNQNNESLEIQKLKDLLSTQESQTSSEVNNQEQDHQQIEKQHKKINKIKHTKPLNKQLKNIVIQLKHKRIQFLDFLKRNQIQQTFTINDLYRFIIDEVCDKDVSVKQRKQYEKSAKNLCSLFKGKYIKIQTLQTKIDQLIRFQFNRGNQQIQNSSVQKKIVKEDLLQKVFKTNIISIFKQQVSSLQRSLLKSQIGKQNLYRLSFNLLLNELQSIKHLIFIEPQLTRSFSRKSNKKIEINPKFDQINISLNLNSNLVIEIQQYIEGKALTHINQKFYALPINRKEEFQTFAKLSTHLNPQSTFMKAKGFYLWEPNKKQLPKQSIRYRWKYIVNFAKQLLHQFTSIHQMGYCCPHLRFSQINQEIKIQKTLYPCKIDSHGKIVELTHQQLFEITDPYSSPEILQKSKNKTTYKVDTWVFGCLLYQFVWGHSPNSYFEELYNFLKQWNMSQDFQDVITMAQPPKQFRYKFFNEKQIKKVFDKGFLFGKFQDIAFHQDIDGNIRKWQSFRGITLPLQTIYGNQLIYYQKQFQILSQIHQLIYEALDPNPVTRPSIEELLTREIFSKCQNFTISSYIQTIKHHLNIEEFQQTILHPSQTLLQESVHHSVSQINTYLSKLINFLTQTLNTQNRSSLIDGIFTIPKSYPFPQNQIQAYLPQEKPYSYSLLKNKDNIMRNPVFDIIVWFFRSGVVKNVIKLLIKDKKQYKDQQQKVMNLINSSFNNGKENQDYCKIEQKVQIILFLIIQMTKKYTSPGCGFVQQILDYVLFYIYEDQSLSVKHKGSQQKYLLLGTQSRLMPGVNKQKQISLSSYLTIPQIHSKKKQFIQKLKNIIFLNGEGNSQYTSISDYLTQNQSTRNMFQIIYSTLDLISQDRTKCELAINYFRDRIYLSQQMEELMKVLKVEILIMRNLNVKSLRQTCLSYFNQILYNGGEVIKLFYTPLFYLSISTILRNPLESINVKIITLEIVKQLIQTQDQQVLSIMKSSTCDIFSFIVRLLIQPKQSSAMHDQYLLLNQKLTQIVHITERSTQLKSIFDQIQAGPYALKHFKGQQYLGQSYTFVD